MPKTSWNAGTARPDYKNKNPRAWYLKNRERILAERKTYRAIHKEKIEIKRKALVEKILRSWIGIIPEIAQCQMCNKDIFFVSNNPAKSIHFDHRHNGIEPIKGSPKHWLRNNLRTPENEALWRSCDFGLLCWQCNRFLPTHDRMQVVINLNRYMGIQSK